MWAFFSRRFRMWLIFSVAIPLVRRLWGRAQANRLASKTRPTGMADATRRPGSSPIPASAEDARTF